VVGKDDEYLTPGEAAPRIGRNGVGRTTARDYFDEGLLRGYIHGKWHRYIEVASIAELNAFLKMPPGPHRDAALDDLRRKNLAARERESGD
jgi:hypothetical protein